VSTTPANLDEARAELNRRCNAIEEAYEFMLAYAAQGITSEQGSQRGGQVREFLQKCDQGLTDLGAFLRSFVGQIEVVERGPYDAFIAVLERDAQHSQAAVKLVLAQPGISSALVDNLNASIHLRALLTDLFLIDEVLKAHRNKKSEGKGEIEM
jgi:hypothetical protein